VNVFTVGTYCYVAVGRGRLGGARRYGAHRGRRGAGHIVAAARPQLVGSLLQKLRYKQCHTLISATAVTSQATVD